MVVLGAAVFATLGLVVFVVALGEAVAVGAGAGAVAAGFEVALAQGEGAGNLDFVFGTLELLGGGAVDGLSFHLAYAAPALAPSASYHFILESDPYAFCSCL